MKYIVKTYAQISSTQDIAAEEIEHKAVEGLVIHAMSMDNGRGRHGNEWQSPMGNLYLSIVLKPDIDMRHCGQLAFVSGMAVVETLKSLAAPDINMKLKWPNDVLVNDKKISGILIEKKQDAFIVGVGLNILAAPEGATKLQDITDKRTPINPVRDFFLDVFDAYYMRWLNEGFKPIQEQWMRYAAYLDEQITVNLPNESKKGIFKGIDEDGRLLLENDETGETEKILSGEVYGPHHSESDKKDT